MKVEDNSLYFTAIGIPVQMGPKDNQDEEEVGIRALYGVDRQAGLWLLDRELEKYPPSYLKWLRLSRFRIVDFMTHFSEETGKPKSIGGLAATSGQVYLVYQPFDPLFYQKTIHHELNHRRNQEHFRHLNNTGIIGAFLAQLAHARWTRAVGDIRNVSYVGERYWNMSFQEKADLERDNDGFVRGYGKVNRWEDNATISEELMMNPAELFEKCRKDSTLGAKVAIVQKDLEWSTNGRMNINFFQDLAAGKVTEEYWDRK